MSFPPIYKNDPRPLKGFLLGLLALLLSVSGIVEAVTLSPVIEENRLQIMMDWPGKVGLNAIVDDKAVAVIKGKQSPSGTKGRDLLLRFNKPLGNVDLDRLSQQTIGWLEFVNTGYDTLYLKSTNKVSYRVYSAGKKIRIEISKLQSEKQPATSSNDERLISFTESALNKNQPELMKPILEKFGEQFLSSRPLLAAQLMLALKDKPAALKWIEMGTGLPSLSLDQQMTLVYLYGKLGQSEKFNQNLNTKKLGNRIAKELKVKGLAKSRREELVYALLELKAYKQALPDLKRLAMSFKGDWPHSYEEVLRKLEMKKALLDFWRLRAKQSGLPAEEKRQLAFQFLEFNSKVEAEKLFFTLAKNAAPDDPDVKQLLYLWGPMPEPSKRNWLIHRVKNSQADEPAEWIRHLINAGGAQEAVWLAEKEHPSKMTDNLFAAYLYALGEISNGAGFASALYQKLKSENNPDRLLLYGSMAEDRGQLQTAGIVYTKLLTLKPDNKRALKRLGLLSFDQSRWEDAEKYLGRLTNRGEEDWETNYYYAETLFILGKKSQSGDFFKRTLELLPKTSSFTPSMEFIQANCQYRLGQSEEAITTYERLMKISPGDNQIRVKYISVLMEMGDFDQAKKWLRLSAN